MISTAITISFVIKLHDALGFLPLPHLLFCNKLLLFRNKLLRVGGDNLGAPLSWQSGDNLTKVSCHRPPESLEANSLGRDLGVVEAPTSFFNVIFASLAGLYLRGFFGVAAEIPFSGSNPRSLISAITARRQMSD
ncbi:MAG: hypothetical protein WAV38_20210, partial [Xanthobacteraceae bacterium]